MFNYKEEKALYAMQHKEIFLNVYVCGNLSDERKKTAWKQLPPHWKK